MPMKDFKFIFQKWILGRHWGWRDQRDYEREVQKVIKRMHGELFVDVGARSLFISHRFHKNFKRIFAFEPNIKAPLPKTTFFNVSLIRCALSDHQGVEMFYLQNNGGADSLIKDFDYDVPEGRGYAPGQKGPFGPTIDSFLVPVSTYDEQIRQLTGGQIADLVKIDVEGSEFEVLKGMAKYPPKAVIVELHDQKREAELILLMRSRHYWAVKLDVCHWLFRLQ